jgi:hypothetical protein
VTEPVDGRHSDDSGEQLMEGNHGVSKTKDDLATRDLGADLLRGAG